MPPQLEGECPVHSPGFFILKKFSLYGRSRWYVLNWTVIRTVVPAVCQWRYLQVGPVLFKPKYRTTITGSYRTMVPAVRDQVPAVPTYQIFIQAPRLTSACVTSSPSGGNPCIFFVENEILENVFPR
jgi:hypothetical protein